jgi:hypothetical protein
MYSPSLAVAVDESNPDHETVLGGLGESQIGVKWRYYEHHRAGDPPQRRRPVAGDPGDHKSDESMNFSLGTYPQALVNNPTNAVRRGVVENGPQYYLPVEFTAKWGPIDFNGEVGRWFGNKLVPSRWGRGLIAGHEFSERLELYGEFYDLQDANRIGGVAKQRQMTLDVGGRQTLDRAGHLRLLFMGGRGMQAVTRQNSEPSWIAYVGVQILFGPKENSK